jgi:hypothetical protein
MGELGAELEVGCFSVFELIIEGSNAWQLTAISQNHSRSMTDRIARV